MLTFTLFHKVSMFFLSHLGVMKLSLLHSRLHSALSIMKLQAGIYVEKLFADTIKIGEDE